MSNEKILQRCEIAQADQWAIEDLRRGRGLERRLEKLVADPTAGRLRQSPGG